MAITRVNPDHLHQTAGYAHVTVVECSRFVVLAGQCPLDAEGRLVGRGDLAAQTDQVVANVRLALAAGGATAEDIVRSVIYVASDDPDVLAAVWRRILDSEIGQAFTTASTLLGVAALGYRDQLVEIDVTAAVG